MNEFLIALQDILDQHNARIDIEDGDMVIKVDNENLGMGDEGVNCESIEELIL